MSLEIRDGVAIVAESGKLARVLIAEDHPMYASALEMALAKVDPAIQAVTVDTLKGACGALDSGRFDLVLLDPGLRDSQGLATIAAIRGSYAAQTILVVSANDSPENQRRARELGVAGFLSKAAPIDRVIEAIKLVASGADCFDDARDNRPAATPMILSPAQMRVMSELAGGHANKEIAYRLGLAEPTVKAHVSAILRVIGVTNRSQAILSLRQAELI